MEVPGRALGCIILISAIAGGYLERQVSGATVVHDTITKDNNIITIIKEKKNKDGSTETDTTIVDKTKEQEKIVATVPAKAPDWLVQGGLGFDRGLTKVYMGSISRRVLGPIYVGAWVSSQEAAGVAVAIQF